MKLFGIPNRDLQKVFLAYLISNLGNYSARLTLSVIIYELTGNPVSLAASFIVTKLPIVIFGNAMGKIASRINQKAILIFSDVVGGVLFVFLAFNYKKIGPLATALVFFVSYSFTSLFDAARAHFVSKLTVTKEELNHAVATFAELIYVAIALGPFIGGHLAEWLQPSSVLLFNALSFLVSIIFISKLSSLPSQDSLKNILCTAFRLSNAWSALENFKVVRDHSMLALFSLFFFTRSITYGLVNALMPVVTLNYLHIGSSGLGNYYLFTCLGAVVGTRLYKRYIGIRVATEGKTQFYFILSASLVEASLLTLCFSSNTIWLFYLVSFLYGIPMLMIESRIDLIFLYYAPVHEKASVHGFQQVVKSIGFTIGIIASVFFVDEYRFVVPGLVFLGIMLPLFAFSRCTPSKKYYEVSGAKTLAP